MEKKKLIFQLDTPYTTVSWPRVGPEDQDTILELLCTLLSPVGNYRAQYVKRSKGKLEKKKKKKKRKRALREAAKTDAEPITPPAPEISSFVDVGLSVVTRALQNETVSVTRGDDAAQDADPGDSGETAASKSPAYSAIFVARSGQPSILNNHLPQMIAVASSRDAEEDAIRLVGLSMACQDRLSIALGIPRVSVVGLRKDAPNSKALVEFVQQHVAVVEASWIQEAQDGGFKATKINTIETTIGSKKQKGN